MIADGVLSAGLSHGVQPVWSTSTATPGGLNSLRILRPGQDPDPRHFVSGCALASGDEVEISTAYGGSVDPKASG